MRPTREGKSSPNLRFYSWHTPRQGGSNGRCLMAHGDRRQPSPGERKKRQQATRKRENMLYQLRSRKGDQRDEEEESN